MSRASRRREARSGRPAKGSGGRKNRAPIWIMSGSIVAALLVLGIIAQRRNPTVAGHHPTPRANASQLAVMPAARYASNARAQQTYTMAAQIPQMLDGVFCYCMCAREYGHYSLLDCFREDHASECDVCMNEATIAYQMTQQGASLDQIRQAVDQQYKT
jgi:Protein of unknown function with PCYCGC motif